MYCKCKRIFIWQVISHQNITIQILFIKKCNTTTLSTSFHKIVQYLHNYSDENLSLDTTLLEQTCFYSQRKPDSTG